MSNHTFIYCKWCTWATLFCIGKLSLRKILQSGEITKKQPTLHFQIVPFKELAQDACSKNSTKVIPNKECILLTHNL